MNCEIPNGLGDMLREFTIAVLRDRPEDLYDFAADYFVQRRDSRVAKTVPMYIVVDEDEDSIGEPDKTTFRPKTQKNKFARRQSVSAERYDPEEDDDDDIKIVHPKSDDQRLRLIEAVSGILIFRCLDSDQMNEVIDAMFERRVEPGSHVIEQGDDGDNFYVIESGTFDVYVKTNNGVDKKVYTFENHGSFGELALLYNMPRSATVVSVDEGTLWAMDRKSFRRIVLKSAFRKRKRYDSLLQSVPLLHKLDNYERMNLADALTSKTYRDQQCIIREGDEADGMYFIENGEVYVTVTQNGEEKPVPSNDAKYFGEMALVENAPRSASVYAKGMMKVAYLERESFERLLGPCLDIMKRNMETYVKST